MPSYFYHIVVELFTQSQPDLHDASLLHGVSDTTSLSVDSICEVLYPFQKRPRQIASNRHSHALLFDQDRCSSLTPFRLPPESSSSSDTTYSIAPPSFNTKSPISTSKPGLDLRLDEVSIQCVDMVPPEQEEASAGRSSRRDRAADNLVATGIGADILGGLRTRGRYIPLDHQASGSVWGIVHLYRDAEEAPYLAVGEYPADLKGSAAARRPGDELSRRENRAARRTGDMDTGVQAPIQPDEGCTTLCVLAVPSYLSPSDFLGFAGEATLDDVSHFRMIRTARANRYMVLMKFRNGKSAREWQRAWNGKVFNSMEPETCHVVFVKTVEIQTADPGVRLDVQPGQHNTSLDPLSSSSPQRGAPGAQTDPFPQATLSTKPLAPPTPALVELPTCPVCLERMDETTGLLTIICQHVFHCTCLQKWKGSGCPVCRYTQDDFRRSSQGLLPGEDPATCSVCHTEENLWVCLICGNIGCGRYDGAHAFAHYGQTSHAFAMDLATQRVWDYVGDAYVHRIIQSKSDGKLVELPAADYSALEPPDWADAVPREKLENMSVEYTHLLTSQLESQRAYFEEVVQRAADKASQAGAAASSAEEAAKRAISSLQRLQIEHDKLVNEVVPSIERDKVRAEKRAEKFEAMARKMGKDLREEKTMNESLMKRIEFLSSEGETLRASNADLTEQNRDLSFFISGSERLKNQSEDVVQGTVSVPEQSNKGKKRRGKK